MLKRARTRVVLRPTRSPKWPNSMAPTGRARKATPKVAREASRAAAGSADGKNRRGNTSTDAVAKM